MSCRRPGQPNNSSRRSSAWKHRRRKTEWKARWLELRLRELKHQQARYEEQLSTLRQAAAAGASTPASPLEATSVPVGDAAGQPGGSDANAISGMQPADLAKGEAQSSVRQAAGTPTGAAEAQTGDGESVPAQHRRRHDRQQARELAAPALLQHPFFAALAGVRKSKQVRCMHSHAGYWTMLCAPVSQKGVQVVRVCYDER